MCICGKDFHLTLTALLHYLVKIQSSCETFTPVVRTNVLQESCKTHNVQVTYSTKNTTVITSLIFVEYMKYRLQIMQQVKTRSTETVHTFTKARLTSVTVQITTKI